MYPSFGGVSTEVISSPPVDHVEMSAIDLMILNEELREKVREINESILWCDYSVSAESISYISYDIQWVCRGVDFHQDRRLDEINDFVQSRFHEMYVERLEKEKKLQE